MGSRGQGHKLTVATCMALAGSPAWSGDCRDDQVHLRGDWGQARFTVELADDPEERARGLMHRESMPQSAGMLFVYPKPRVVGFWMKDTLIPLDILFLDRTGTVTKIHHEAKPHDETVLFGGDSVSAALEINGGMARRMGIIEGSQMRHPAFAPDLAAWPCDGEGAPAESTVEPSAGQPITEESATGDES